MKTALKSNIDLDKRNIPSGLSRRSFLKRMGGGLVIAVSLSDFSTLQAAVVQELPKDFNAFLRIGLDGRVSCFTGKIEMGQGVNTSLSQMIAEELDVTVDDVDMVMGDTDLCPYDRGTWGSLTTRVFGPALRSAGAEARAVLIEMASEQLGEPKNTLSVENGVVQKIGSPNKKISYAELTQGKKIVKSLRDKPVLKKPEEFKIIGKPYKRRDALEKVTGGAKYAGDIRIEGMLYAKILRPPVHGARLISVDTAGAESLEDVVLVNQDDMIAVLHPHPEVAERALNKIDAKFENPAAKVNDQSIFDYLVENAGSGRVQEEKGDLAKGKEATASVVESKFFDGYVAHAPMETHTAIAYPEKSRMVVYASTQNPFGVKAEVARALGMGDDDVLVKQVLVGGGFGGKSKNKQAVEAAKLAKITKKPVQVAWSRKEEFFYDSYRPAAVVDIKAGIDKEGKITFWDYGTYFAGSRGSDIWYNIPNHKVVSYNGSRNGPAVHPFATGSWRAPGNNTNSFARESHINILAEKAGMDPLEFRLKNLTDPRMLRVLKACAEKFDWKSRKKQSGKGFGIACGTDAGTYVAEMAEVEVDKATGEVKVNRVVCAQDMGLVINPQGANLQIEGCIVMGLGYCLKEDIEFEGGDIKNKSFGKYELPKFSWLPKIETVLIDAQNEPAQGGGEPAIVIMGGLIANAIYDAIGVRLYQLPMSPARIKAALA
jgi:nicotinate dehydrogenase subunit B